MKLLQFIFSTSLICIIFSSGCRQIFGDGEQSESIVQAPIEPSKIIVTAPKFGSIWKPGEIINIKRIAPSIKRIEIQLYRKSNYQFTITENLDNKSSFDWTIPLDINLSNQYLVKISNFNKFEVFQFSERFGIH